MYMVMYNYYYRHIQLQVLYTKLTSVSIHFYSKIALHIHAQVIYAHV